MKNQSFDERIRRKVQRENWTPSIRSRQMLAETMRLGKSKEKPFVWWPKTAAACLAALAVLILVLTIQPPLDARNHGLLQGNSTFVMADGQPLETPVPITEPEVHFSTCATGRLLSATAVFANHTNDIWLLAWKAAPTAEHEEGYAEVKKPTQYIWLEPGADYTDTVSGCLTSETVIDAVEVVCSYSAYRVTADQLFWQDGLLQTKNGADYPDQQDLLEDAFSSGALMLYAQQWQKGTAGGVKLLLPDSVLRVNSDALQHYVDSGALTLGASALEVVKTPVFPLEKVKPSEEMVEMEVQLPSFLNKPLN